MARKKVAIVHPNGIRGEVLPESVDAWVRRGWTRVDDVVNDTEQPTLFCDEVTDPDEPGDNEE